jgi:hypothetical protein
MSAFRFGNFHRGWLLAAMLMAAAQPAASQGYTPDQQQACSDDAFRLCSAEIPDVDRVTVCMVRNKSQLSPACRVFFRADPEEAVTPVAAGRPQNIRPGTSRKPAHAKLHKPRKPGAT